MKASNSSEPNTRSDLLNQIRQGVELKSVLHLNFTIGWSKYIYIIYVLKVQPILKKTTNNLEMDGLAGALARALAERARVIQSSSSDSSDGDDDDWDD